MKIENIKAVLTARYEKDAQTEDPGAYRSLQNHLVYKNAGRVSVFSIFSLLAGVFELVSGVGTIFCNIGSIILIISSVVLC